MRSLKTTFSLFFALIVSKCTHAYERSGNNHQIRDAAQTARSKYARELEELEPICVLYNRSFNGTMICNCSGDDFEDAVISCTYQEPQCSAEDACYDGGIVITNDAAGDVFNVTTCTNFTTSPRLLDSCVEVLPTVAGNFSSISSCTAQLNGEVCNYCHVCDDSKTIKVDCCNAVEDAVQSECLPVTENGAFIPNFDQPPSNPGQCNGTYEYNETIHGGGNTGGDTSSAATYLPSITRSALACFLALWLGP
jgi:hypothetical protein